MADAPLRFFISLLVMAGITYLIRMLPLALCKKKLKNRFVCSFLHYVPYAVLSAMTVPAIFYATASPLTAAIGFIVALVFAFFRRSLLTVALAASAAVFLFEWIFTLFSIS